MKTMSAESKKEIVRILSDRGAKNPCPRCDKTSFTLLDGYFNQNIQPEITGDLIIGGPAIPSIVIICNNCGYMSQHALGVLGLLSEMESKNDPKQ